MKASGWCSPAEAPGTLSWPPSPPALRTEAIRRARTSGQPQPQARRGTSASRASGDRPASSGVIAAVGAEVLTPSRSPRGERGARADGRGEAGRWGGGAVGRTAFARLTPGQRRLILNTHVWCGGGMLC